MSFVLGMFLLAFKVIFGAIALVLGLVIAAPVGVFILLVIVVIATKMFGGGKY